MDEVVEANPDLSELRDYLGQAQLFALESALVRFPEVGEDAHAIKARAATRSVPALTWELLARLTGMFAVVAAEESLSAGSESLRYAGLQAIAAAERVAKARVALDDVANAALEAIAAADEHR